MDQEHVRVFGQCLAQPVRFAAVAQVVQQDAAVHRQRQGQRRFPFVEVCGRQEGRDDQAAVMDQRVQLEPEEPARRALAEVGPSSRRRRTRPCRMLLQTRIGRPSIR